MTASRHAWLRSARWNLTFLVFSVGLVVVPYAVYLFYAVSGGGSARDASVKGTDAYNARILVNYLVALLIGGPHMYATFTRTVMDRDFLPNMDTAFQGINVWHSFQYLALTWYANRLREQRTGQRLGFLHLWEDWSARVRVAGGPGRGWRNRARRGGAALLGTLRRVDRDTGWSTFYMLCLAMLPISGVLILAAGTFWPQAHGDLPSSDEAYTYMGILSVLLVHYVHDALLFTDRDALVETRPSSPAPTAVHAATAY